MKALLTTKIAALAIACFMVANAQAGTSSWGAGNGAWNTISWTGAGGAGDFDGDGDIDGSDFLKWQRDGLSASDLTNWQNGYAGGGGGGLVSSFDAFGHNVRINDDDVATIANGSTVTGNPDETSAGAEDGGGNRFQPGSVLNISGGSTLVFVLVQWNLER